MANRMHMVRSYKETCHSDTMEVDKDGDWGTPFDSDISVRYFRKVYFKSEMQLEIEEWLETHFRFRDATFFKFDMEDTGAIRNIGKSAFARVLQDDELLQDAVKDAIDSGIAESEEEVMDFINEALATESEDEIVRIEFW